jgi:hypothetical protein
MPGGSGGDMGWWYGTCTTAAESITITTVAADAWVAFGAEVTGSVSSVISGGTATFTTGTTDSLTVSSLASGYLVFVIANSEGNFDNGYPTSPWTVYHSGTFLFTNGLNVAYQTVTATSVTATWTGPLSGVDESIAGLILEPLNAVNVHPAAAPAAGVGVNPTVAITTVNLIQQGDTGALINSGTAVTMPGTVTAGHTVILQILSLGTTTGDVTSVTSNFGTFTKREALAGASGDMELWDCLNATGGGQSITVTTTSASQYVLLAQEWSGLGTFISGTTTNGTSTSPGLSQTPTASGELVITSIRTPTAETAQPLSPWTDYNAGIWINSNGIATAWQVSPSTSALDPVWTQTSAAWLAVGGVYGYGSPNITPAAAVGAGVGVESTSSPTINPHPPAASAAGVGVSPTKAAGTPQTIIFDTEYANGYTWICPPGVTTISVTCGVTTNAAYSVTPGTTYAITNTGSGTSFNGAGVTGAVGSVSLTYTYNPGIIGGINYGNDAALVAESTGAINTIAASMKAAGCTYWRIDSPWISGTTVTGPFDAEVTAALAAGMTPLILLYDSSSGGDYGNGTWGHGVGTFAAWCTNAATHYLALGCHYYEIGNEVNLGANWQSGTVTPATYTSCLQSAYANIKAVDSTATVLFSGMASYAAATGTLTPASNMAVLDFLNACYAQGAQGYFDAFNVHPYGYQQLADGSTDGGYPNELQAWNTWDILSNIHSTMNTNGDGSKKIWITEFGFPTGGDASITPYGDQNQQALAIAEVIQLAASYSYVGPVMPFSWQDDIYDGDFGFLTSAGVAKTSLAIWECGTVPPPSIGVSPGAAAGSGAGVESASSPTINPHPAAAPATGVGVVPTVTQAPALTAALSASVVITTVDTKKVALTASVTASASIAGTSPGTVAISAHISATSVATSRWLKAVMGVLGPSGSNYTQDYAAGIRCVTIGAAWVYIEPTQGSFSGTALATLQAQITAAIAAGMTVSLDIGTQYAPAWALSLSGGALFKDQFGNTFGPASEDGSGNYCVNPFLNTNVQSAYSAYVAYLGANLTGVSYVRVGGGPTAELRYPSGAADSGSNPNAWWAYDATMQAACPVPGWTPGTGNTTQATEFLNWYNQTLVNFGVWWSEQIYAAFPGVTQLIMLPSWGERPNQIYSGPTTIYQEQVASLLTLGADEWNQGLDWTDLLPALPYPTISVAYCTWLDATSGGVGNPNPIQFIAGLSGPLGIPTGGENTGGGGVPALQTSLNAMATYQGVLFSYAFESELVAGTPTYTQFLATLSAMSGNSESVSLTAAVSANSAVAGINAETVHPVTAISTSASVGGVTFDTQIGALSPSAFWELADAPGSSVAADSIDGHPGTPTSVTFGAWTPVPTSSETGASFNGTSSRISTSFNPSGLSAFSSVFIVNAQGNAQSYTRLLSNDYTSNDNKGIDIFVNGTTSLQVLFSLGNGTTYSINGSDNTFSASGTHLIVCTWDGTTQRIYIDGTLDPYTGSLSGTLAAGSTNLMIGANPTFGPGSFFQGEIARVATFPSALSGTAISGIYTALTTFSSANNAEAAALTGALSASASVAGTVTPAFNVLPLAASAVGIGVYATPAVGAAPAAAPAAGVGVYAIPVATPVPAAASASGIGTYAIPQVNVLPLAAPGVGIGVASVETDAYPLTVALSATSAVTAAISVVLPITASLSTSSAVAGTSTEAVALTVSIAASGAVAASTSEALALTTAISASVTLASSVSGTVSVSPLAAVGSGVGVYATPLVGAVPAAAPASGVGVAPTITVNPQTAAAVASGIGVGASVTGAYALTDAISASVSIAGAPTEIVAISDALTASVAIAATNKETVALTTAISSSVAVSATNATTIALSAALSATSATTTTDIETVALSVAISASASVAASTAGALNVLPLAAVGAGVGVYATPTVALATAASVASGVGVYATPTVTVLPTAAPAAGVGVQATVTGAYALTAALSASGALAATAAEAVALNAAIVSSASVAASTAGTLSILPLAAVGSGVGVYAVPTVGPRPVGCSR